jgi:hypothetical protein
VISGHATRSQWKKGRICEGEASALSCSMILCPNSVHDIVVNSISFFLGRKIAASCYRVQSRSAFVGVEKFGTGQAWASLSGWTSYDSWGRVHNVQGRPMVISSCRKRTKEAGRAIEESNDERGCVAFHRGYGRIRLRPKTWVWVKAWRLFPLAQRSGYLLALAIATLASRPLGSSRPISPRIKGMVEHQPCPFRHEIMTCKTLLFWPPNEDDI